MNLSLITIWRSALSDSPRDKDLRARSRTVLSFDEFKNWLDSKEYFRHVFRYGGSVLRVYDLTLNGRPFFTALFLWLLAPGNSSIQDDLGEELRISPPLILSLFWKRLKESFKISTILRGVQDEVDSLRTAEIQIKKLDLSKRPVYLRTDLVFGLKSGGSVGHIAGVLNHLGDHAGLPLFLTTDLIPTVLPSLPTRRIVPSPDFWDFNEVLALNFNRKFFQLGSVLLKDTPISFIYQRCGLNNFSGVKLAAKFQVPLVLEYNGSAVWVGRQWQRGLKYEKLSAEIERLNLHRADLVVVVSRPLKEALLREGVPDEKILINPNGVDLEKYSPRVEGSQVRARWGLEGKRVIGFIGTFGRWHGAEVLAEAFGKLLAAEPSFRGAVRLLLIGGGERMYRVKEVLKEYGVEDDCVLTGTVPQEDGPAHLAACDLLVSPTVPNRDGTPFFGSPTKLFEYMAMGKGIVASDLDQIGEVLEHDLTGWMVKPGDPESLRMGLKTLLEDEPRRLRLGNAAREEAAVRYSWKEHTRKIIEKLQERCP